MAVVKCEFCAHEQDIDVSRLCDNCGKRLTRTRDDFPSQKVVAGPQKIETMRCPKCGVPSSKEICSNCGAQVRPTTI